MKVKMSNLERILALLLTALLASCAGVPENRLLDTAGVDPARYNNDLYDCKLYASQYGWEQGIDKTGNMLGGALLGGAVAVATGGIFSPKVADAMFVGAALGGVVNMANAGNARKAEPIVGESAKFLVTDCMRDKGYRIVQGSAPQNPNGGNLPAYIASTPGAAQTLLIGPIAPSALPFSQGAELIKPATANPPTPVTAKSLNGTAASDSAGAVSVQRFRAQAERLAKQNACKLPVTALHAGQSATSESYSTTCSNGGALIIQCDRGLCKVLSR